MDTGRFALFLLGALLLSGLFSYFQQRAYIAVTRRLAQQFGGNSAHVLVSGRSKGILRGAVVVLVLDSTDQQVLAAEAMVGRSVLAKFRVRAELLGSSLSVVERATGKSMKKAVQGCLEQAEIVRRKGARAPSRQRPARPEPA
ncbi:transcriptional regulator [Cryobacterium suzukii]|uniref:Transcriptional regulator n=1 Tax=Cryobacterium suzukii TaxID=1259198 RepID=A0A4R9AG63_9MICO|nr:transcriptional regulator GutM [Cryobacterium suzukii]TFD61471.1 transcriptional regulator [Cryobacterium suzukii]